MRRLLFICSRNRLRSPTAEALFGAMDGIEVSSAGTAPDAECPVSSDLMEWASDLIVMEPVHRRLLQKRFGPAMRDKRVICLGIADEFGYMQAELVELLKMKVLPLIGESETR